MREHGESIFCQYQCTHVTHKKLTCTSICTEVELSLLTELIDYYSNFCALLLDLHTSPSASELGAPLEDKERLQLPPEPDPSFVNRRHNRIVGNTKIQIVILTFLHMRVQGGSQWIQTTILCSCLLCQRNLFSTCIVHRVL